MRVVVAQKGAREHFLAARALQRRGMLAKLVVDWYAPANPLLRLIVGYGFGYRRKAALAARSVEIPASMVLAKRFTGLLGKWKQSVRKPRKSAYETNMEVDIAFTESVARSKLPMHDIFFGYSYMSLEMLKLERERNVLTILDQIDPGPFEFRLVAEEMANNPRLAGVPPEYPGKYYERLRQEWDAADVILVNSEWCRDAIVAEGADSGKIEILPLAFESDDPAPIAGLARQRTGPLKVLWLGQVNVRKGIHYLIEAARLLTEEPVRFEIVGAIGITADAVAACPGNMTFHGAVARDRAVEWYKEAHVFVLPTLSDGFAITQLESMAQGVPVITTTNCGRVVEEGKTGFIVPARDAAALAEAILRFVRNRELLGEMAPNCRKVAATYSIDAYGKRLVEIMEKRLSASRLNGLATHRGNRLIRGGGN